MSLDNLKEMWKSDSTILDGNDGYPDFLKACNETPYLHSKYLELYCDYKSKMIDQEFAYKFLVKEKWMYYKKKAPASAYKDIPFDLKLLASTVAFSLVFYTGWLVTQKSFLASTRYKTE